ncbi:hypothetical protein BH10PSE14_BH10PSE14_18310 [soil metagenome]
MRWMLVGAGAALLASCTQTRPAPFICPQAETGALKGSLHESPDQIATAGQRLGRGSENEIAELAGALRKVHPEASAGAIVNYMVTAYCPAIDRRADLDAAAKARALSAFSRRADRIVTATIPVQ